MGDQAYSRKGQGKGRSDENARWAFDMLALADAIVQVADPIRYTLIARSHEANTEPVLYEDVGLISALTANDSAPTSSEPTAARTIIGAGVSKIGLWCNNACTLAVWTRAKVASAVAGHVGEAAYMWVRVAVVTFLGTTADVEQVVSTRFRDVFVQVVSGAAQGTPITVRIGAC